MDPWKAMILVEDTLGCEDSRVGKLIQKKMLLARKQGRLSTWNYSQAMGKLEREAIALTKKLREDTNA